MIRARLILAAALSLPLLAAPRSPAQSLPSQGQQLSVGDSKLLLVLPPDAFASPALLTQWAQRSARIVAHYYGQFPAAQVRIVVIPVAGARVAGGTTFGRPAPLIRVRVGTAVDAAALLNDWVLVHEMTHLALPDIGDDHAWLAEGLAVYIEGVARVQSGNRTLEDVFAEEERSMPRGLPGADDPGLDHDHSWGRTYWGGAMFCLLADVSIHQRTHNRFGLQDAMKAVLRASGGLPSDWSIGKVLATADAAVGVPVMTELYAKMKDQPFAPDLPALWRSLGVEAEGSTVRINDQAPLAAIRKAIFKSP
ncbi:MAG TPA: hypothetical protein VK700_13470 [Steroidobacteraceae bacterium]|jgi:hypothetical protein|nr:hypothetical protein [Steroidobacteraceae bacterium]